MSSDFRNPIETGLEIEIAFDCNARNGGIQRIGETRHSAGVTGHMDRIGTPETRRHRGVPKGHGRFFHDRTRCTPH